MQLLGDNHGDELHDALDQGVGQLLRLRGVLDSSGVSSGLGMSISEAMGLRRLAEGAMTQQELGAYLGLEKSTVSRLVDALIAEGWARKQRDPHNGRLRNVTLTPAGHEAAQRVNDAMRDRHARVFGSMTEEERQALAIALPALVRALAATEK